MKKEDPGQTAAATAARNAGIACVRANPVLAGLAGAASIIIDKENGKVSPKGWIAVSPSGTIWLHPKRRADPLSWARLIAAALTCLGFGLVRKQEPYILWELTSFLVADRFCAELKLGPSPDELLNTNLELPGGGAEGLLRHFCVDGCPPPLTAMYAELSGGNPLFCNLDESADDNQYRHYYYRRQRPKWRELLADGIARGVGHALQVVAGVTASDGSAKELSPAQKAKRRLIDNFPLLGALAASFDVVEDLRQCQQYDIRVAAIDVGARRIWINASAGLNGEEYLFVFAHELLHAGLNHASRRRGRDALLWNIACDFIINGWLIEMQVGTPPHLGLLHDPDFAGQSSEEVYDTLAQDLRRARKLATLRGPGEQDMLGEDDCKQFTDAESYCRRALAQGMERVILSNSRSLIPAGLIEEIRSLAQPPIPWDVKLAEWFDQRFPTLELRRSYARPSRRQSATPDIARPRVVKPNDEQRASRVFGVLLDTSGSMAPKLLGQALGAIASYALARDVFAVRLICCDAKAYDSGWVEPENLLDRFSLRGRGGTILQPGLDCLENLAARGEFPRHGPLLIITDGYFESMIRCNMDHAFLLPEGQHLPFHTSSDIFFIK